MKNDLIKTKRWFLYITHALFSIEFLMIVFVFTNSIVTIPWAVYAIMLIVTWLFLFIKSPSYLVMSKLFGSVLALKVGIHTSDLYTFVESKGVHWGMSQIIYIILLCVFVYLLAYKNKVVGINKY